MTQMQRGEKQGRGDRSWECRAGAERTEDTGEGGRQGWGSIRVREAGTIGRPGVAAGGDTSRAGDWVMNWKGGVRSRSIFAH